MCGAASETRPGSGCGVAIARAVLELGLVFRVWPVQGQAPWNPGPSSGGSADTELWLWPVWGGPWGLGLWAVPGLGCWGSGVVLGCWGSDFLATLFWVLARLLAALTAEGAGGPCGWRHLRVSPAQAWGLLVESGAAHGLPWGRAGPDVPLPQFLVTLLLLCVCVLLCHVPQGPGPCLDRKRWGLLFPRVDPRNGAICCRKAGCRV